VRSADPALLKSIARARPGDVRGYWPLRELDQLAEELVAPVRRRQAVDRPQSNWPRYTTSVHGLAMLLFVGLLSTEWLLRRRWQLQ
jgi:hypothetical protein